MGKDRKDLHEFIDLLGEGLSTSIMVTCSPPLCWVLEEAEISDRLLKPCTNQSKAINVDRYLYACVMIYLCNKTTGLQ